MEQFQSPEILKKFPGLSIAQAIKLKMAVDNMGISDPIEREQEEKDLYQALLPKIKEQEYKRGRVEMQNDLYNKKQSAKEGTDEYINANLTLKLSEFADKIREQEGISSDYSDEDIVKNLSEGVPNFKENFTKYLNGDDTVLKELGINPKIRDYGTKLKIITEGNVFEEDKDNVKPLFRQELDPLNDSLLKHSGKVLGNFGGELLNTILTKKDMDLSDALGIKEYKDFDSKKSLGENSLNFLNNIGKGSLDVISGLGNFAKGVAGEGVDLLKAGTKGLYSLFGSEGPNWANKERDWGGKPLQTLGKLLLGAGLNATNNDNNIEDSKLLSEANDIADNVGKFYKGKYGGVEQTLKTAFKDPVGVLSDVTTLAGNASSATSGITKLASKGAKIAGATNTANKLANISSKASSLAKNISKYDPENIIADGTKKIIGKISDGTVSATKKTYKGSKGLLGKAQDNIAGIFTNTKTGQDKLFHAQGARVTNANIKTVREQSDRANNLILEAGYLPTTTSTRKAAHEAVMNSKWKEIENIINKGKKIEVDMNIIADTLQDYINKRKGSIIESQKGDIKLLNEQIKSFRKDGKKNIKDIEELKQNINYEINWGDKTKGNLYNNAMREATKKIGKIMNEQLSKIPDEFQNLKNDYGALKSTYDDIVRADIKNMKRKETLLNSYNKIDSLGELVDGAANNGAIGLVGKGIKALGRKILGDSYSRANSPDFLIEKGFEQLNKKRLKLKK